MKAFAQLYGRLDATTSSNAKLAALQDYFSQAQPADAAWAVYFLAGGRPRQLVPSRVLREIGMQQAALPEWLFEESYQAVGDLAETLSLLLPESLHSSEAGLADWIEHHLLPLRGASPEDLAQRLPALWAQLDQQSLMVCIKLITGSFRVGVSKLLVTRALAALAGVDSKRVAQRLVGYTELSRKPSAADYLKLIAEPSADEHAQRGGQPYPFFLAHPLQLPVEQFEAQLGPPTEWQVEWKWDGIRAQLVKRDGQVWLWSRGEELISERFPELLEMGAALPDGSVIDGEIVVWNHAPQAGPRVQPFALLQQRIGRKTLSKKILQEIPVVLLAYDLLEWQGQDWRQHPQHYRRAQLEAAVDQANQPALQLSPIARARLVGLGATTHRVSGLGCGRDDAQSAHGALRRRAHQGRGRVVEMESRPVQCRRRAHLRPTRAWSACEPLQRLHLCRMGRTAGKIGSSIGALRQGLFRVN